jgi:P pilus assembly chaperone PapD
MSNTLFMKAGIAIGTLFILAFGSQLVSTPNSTTQGDLVIMPRRVILDARKRTQELNIANSGADTAKYLISVVHYRMLENGAFEEIFKPDSAQYFADKHFRFFPRSVTLAPNESQTIKIQTINTNDMQAGEYRSHLYFRAVADEPVGDKATKIPKSLSVQLVPTFGTAIPVIIRNGNTSVKVNIEKPQVVWDANKAPQLKMAFKRSGNISVYGDLTVQHIAPTGKTTQVALAKGLAIYTPNQIRTILLNLDKNQSVDYHKGKLNIIYSTSGDSKTEVITSSQIDLL